jgi:hypothetical protein
VAGSFDPRVVPPALLELVRACQREVDVHLGGGAVLSGAHLRHRLTRDLDLFVHDRAEHRQLVRRLSELAGALDLELSIVLDAVLAWFLRARFSLPRRKPSTTREHAGPAGSALPKRVPSSAADA